MGITAADYLLLVGAGGGGGVENETMSHPPTNNR